MFARSYRLPFFVRLYHARIIHTPLFTLKIASNSLENNRYGFVAGKSIDKRAVVRNRIKRQFRAGVEALHKNLESGNDLLFILKKEAGKVSSRQLHKEAEKVLQKQRLL